jgi:hypothetical protein
MDEDLGTNIEADAVARKLKIEEDARKRTGIDPITPMLTDIRRDLGVLVARPALGAAPGPVPAAIGAVPAPAPAPVFALPAPKPPKAPKPVAGAPSAPAPAAPSSSSIPASLTIPEAYRAAFKDGGDFLSNKGAYRKGAVAAFQKPFAIETGSKPKTYYDEVFGVGKNEDQDTWLYIGSPDLARIRNGVDVSALKLKLTEASNQSNVKTYNISPGALYAILAGSDLKPNTVMFTSAVTSVTKEDLAALNDISKFTDGKFNTQLLIFINNAVSAQNAQQAAAIAQAKQAAQAPAQPPAQASPGPSTPQRGPSTARPGNVPALNLDDDSDDEFIDASKNTPSKPVKPNDLPKKVKDAGFNYIKEITDFIDATANKKIFEEHNGLKILGRLANNAISYGFGDVRIYVRNINDFTAGNDVTEGITLSDKKNRDPKTKFTYHRASPASMTALFSDDLSPGSDAFEFVKGSATVDDLAFFKELLKHSPKGRLANLHYIVPQKGNGLKRAATIDIMAMNPTQIKRRYNVLKGEIGAGNNNPDTKNELVALADILSDKGKITRNEHERAYIIAGMI